MTIDDVEQQLLVSIKIFCNDNVGHYYETDNTNSANAERIMVFNNDNRCIMRFEFSEE